MYIRFKMNKMRFIDKEEIVEHCSGATPFQTEKKKKHTAKRKEEKKKGKFAVLDPKGK